MAYFGLNFKVSKTFQNIRKTTTEPRLSCAMQKKGLKNLYKKPLKNCDKKFKTILVKSLKMRRRFDVRLTSLSSQNE